MPVRIVVHLERKSALHLTPAFSIYLSLWTAATFAASVTAVTSKSMRESLTGYGKFLAMPWKVMVFLPAAIFVTFAGSFAFDDTWDTVTGLGMSILTFATAPWAFGTAWLTAMGRRPRWHISIALVASLFSASWFYDGWLLWRDGSYTPMWLPNLLLSPFLYCAGGALWNLEVGTDGKPTLGFLRPDWPSPPANSQLHPALLAVSLPPILLAAAILLVSVRWNVAIIRIP